MAGELSDRSWHELKLLHELCADDLREFKSRQWQILNYALLTFGAFGVIGKQYEHEQAILVVMAFFAMAAAWLAHGILKGLEQAIALRRDRMAAIRKHFSPEFTDALLPHDKRGKEPKLDVLRFCLVAGLVLLLLYLWGVR